MDEAKRSRSVLIVEDDPVSRALLQGFLEDAGYDVEAAEDGGDALAKLGEGSFDLVLADIDMPGLNGLKMLELVGRRGLAVPVVFLTGLEGRDVEIRGFELGAADFIHKPVRKDLLLQRIENVLRRGARYVALHDDEDAEGRT